MSLPINHSADHLKICIDGFGELEPSVERERRRFRIARERRRAPRISILDVRAEHVADVALLLNAACRGAKLI